MRKTMLSKVFLICLKIKKKRKREKKTKIKAIELRLQHVYRMYTDVHGSTYAAKAEHLTVTLISHSYGCHQ